MQEGSCCASSEAPLPVILHEAASAKAEAEFVVATLEALLGGHSFFSVDSGRADRVVTGGLGFADVAVLYRSEAVATEIVAALSRSGMPFQRRSHGPVSERREVRLLLEAMGAEDAAGEGTVAERLAAAAVAVAAAHRDDPAPLQAVEQAAELLRPLAAPCGREREAFRWV